jgi:DNA-binding response OmpR family regulator
MEPFTSVLVVDDEENVRYCIQVLLEREGFRIVSAKNGIEALSLLEAQPVDLILADIAMPQMNGYQLYQRVTSNPQWVTIPFIFLTARGSDSDVRYGKELGADDYVIKPFKRDDLLATVRGSLRRSRQLAKAYAQNVRPPGMPEVVALGKLRVNLSQRRVSLNGTQVRLSAREFELLACLARQEHKVVPLQDLVQATHGLETDREEAGSLLRPLIRSLRRKLGYPAGQMGCIENVRGVGYQLIDPQVEET